MKRLLIIAMAFAVCFAFSLPPCQAVAKTANANCVARDYKLLKKFKYKKYSYDFIDEFDGAKNINDFDSKEYVKSKLWDKYQSWFADEYCQIGDIDYSEVTDVAVPRPNPSNAYVEKHVLKIMELLKGSMFKDFARCSILVRYDKSKYGSKKKFRRATADKIWNYFDPLCSIDSQLLTLEVWPGEEGSQYYIFIDLTLNGTVANHKGATKKKRKKFQQTLRSVVKNAEKQTDGSARQKLLYYCWFIDKNIYYDYKNFNRGYGYTQDSISAINDKKAVCRGFAATLQDLCVLGGVKCLLMSNERHDHAWNQVYIGGKWQHIDLVGTNGPKKGKYQTGWYTFTHPKFDETHAKLLKKLKKAAW